MSTETNTAPEERRYRVLAEHSEMGRSTVDLRCPFCEARVTAYKWSLAGGGKRCTCGAKFTSLGTSVKR